MVLTKYKIHLNDSKTKQKIEKFLNHQILMLILVF